MRRFNMLIKPGMFLAIVVLFLVGNAAVFTARKYTDRTDGLIAVLVVFLLGLTAGIYGIYRATYFHPFYRPEYTRFLARSPWTWDVPLPLGPLLLVWEDLVVVACLSSMAYLTSAFCDPGDLSIVLGPHLPTIVAVLVFAAFFLSYLSCLARSTSADMPTAAAVAFLVPLIVYPHFNLLAAVGVVVTIYLVLIIGVRRTLGRFPWNTPDWTASAEQKYLSEARVKGLIGWPYHPLGPWDESLKANKPREVLLAAVLAAWWAQSLAGFCVHVSRSTWEAALPFAQDPIQGSGPSVVFLGICIALAVFRTVIYTWGYVPPISLRGRIFTGRWIIPGYDRIAVAPALVLLFGWFGPRCLYALGVPAFLLWAVCTFIAVMIAYGLGPSLESWRLTGQFRVVNVMPQQTRDGRAVGKGDWKNVEIKIFER